MTEPLAPLLVALTGRAGAGKSTAAAHLEDEYAFTSIAFADPLLDALGALAQHADVDGAWLVDRVLKELPMPVLSHSYRTLARTVADALRALDPDVFVRIALHRVRQARAMGNNVVVTDVRYPNEAAALRALGAHTVRINRSAGLLASVGAHSSEQYIATLPVEGWLDNDGSKAVLFDQLDGLIHALRSPTP